MKLYAVATRKCLSLLMSTHNVCFFFFCFLLLFFVSMENKNINIFSCKSALSGAMDIIGTDQTG